MCCFSQRHALTLKIPPTSLKVLSATIKVFGFIILKRLSRQESRKQTFFTTTQKRVGFQENKSYLNYSSSPNFTWATVKCVFLSLERKIKLTLEILQKYNFIHRLAYLTHIFNNVKELYPSRRAPEITIVNALLTTCQKERRQSLPKSL